MPLQLITWAYPLGYVLCSVGYIPSSFFVQIHFYTVDTLLTRMHAVETTQKKIQETQDTVLKKLCEIEDYMRRRSLVNTPNLPEYNATSYDLYQDSYSPHYSP